MGNFTIRDTKECKHCGAMFHIRDGEQKVLEKHGFSHTNICPQCTFRMLYSYFNDKHLYHRRDSYSGEKIISIYDSSFSGSIMDVTQYREKLTQDYAYDFKRNSDDDIFQAFYDMYSSFPRPSRLVFLDTENSDYASHVGWSKNVYMSFGVFVDCENVFHSYCVVQGSKNVFYSFKVQKNCSNIYESSIIKKSHNIFFSHYITNSSNIWYSRDMEGCQECIFCTNRVNTQYMVFNISYSKEEYFRIKQEIITKMQDPEQREYLDQRYNIFLQENYFEPGLRQQECENVVGDIVHSSKNCYNIFLSGGCENSINTINLGELGDTTYNNINSVDGGTIISNAYNSCSLGVNCDSIFYSYAVTNNSSNIYYSLDLESCQECMFCIGLRGKKYHILNTPYSKLEYFETKNRIIQDLQKKGQWGQELGWSLTGFPYNDTLAYDYFGVHSVVYADGSEEIIDRDAMGVVYVHTNDFIAPARLDLGGKESINILWRTKEKEINIPEKYTITDSESITDTKNLLENITEKVFLCTKTQRPYKITSQERDFLKKHQPPFSQYHPDYRLNKLVQMRPIGNILQNQSDISGEDIYGVYKQSPGWKILSNNEYRTRMYQ